MPILASEPDIYPYDLFQQSSDSDDALDSQWIPDSERSWWVFYTLSRREKVLMRHLRAARRPFYGPLVPKRNCAASGRIRTSYVPLFPNYVFMLGTAEDRHSMMATNCISRWMRVEDGQQLVRDLSQIRRLIEAEAALTVESRIQPGQVIRVRKGAFAGYEGVVVRRRNQTRLVIVVQFLQQGVSVLLEDCQVEPI